MEAETILPEHGRDHMKRMLDEAELYYNSSKPLRIGHGTHVAIDDMLRIAEQGHYVEACLSSNKRTGVIDASLRLSPGSDAAAGCECGNWYRWRSPLLDHTGGGVCLCCIQHRQVPCQAAEAPMSRSSLPNGDQLCVRHIRQLMRSEMVPSVETRLQQPITYRELPELVKPEILQRISSETLVESALTLLELCYGVRRRARAAPAD